MSPEPHNIKGFRRLHDALTRAASDDDYRQKLLSDPKSALEDAKLEVPDDVEIVVHENEPKRLHLVIPSKVTEWDQLDEDAIDITVIFEVGF